MDFPVNRFKQRLLAGEQQVGLWSSLSSAAATEILADSGFDWILIDTEHAPNETPMVADQLRAASMGRASPVVRPAWNDAVILKRLLDVGVQTLLVPFIQNAAEAARAVAATRYPPRGMRGVASVHRANRYGRVPDYFARADDEMCVLVQLETRPGGRGARRDRRRRRRRRRVHRAVRSRRLTRLPRATTRIRRSAIPSSAPAGAPRQSARRLASWRRSRAMRARIWTWASPSSRSAAMSSCCARGAMPW